MNEGMRALLIPLLWLAAPVMPAEKTPRFEDYPVADVYRGPVASPLLVRPEERLYRTVIRDGVRKGYGVVDEPSGNTRPGPNFAGHYVVVQWGCGTECLQYAIVDAKSGRVFQPPVPGKHIAYFDTGRLDYRTRSKLMVVSTDCAIYNSEGCDRDYYLWSNERWTHLHRQRRSAN